MEIERIDMKVNEKLNHLAAMIFENKELHGWAITDRDAWDNSAWQVPADLALIHSEVSEALEAFRNRNIDEFGDELADIVIRVVGLADALGIDLWLKMVQAVIRSSIRPHKHGGKRL